MGKPAVLLRHKLIALVAVGLLSCGILPLTALADGNGTVAGPLAGPGYENDARSASADPSVEGAILASSLAPNGASIVSADVALDAAEPIVGSFTVDGLTYAVGSDGLTLVAVDAAAVSDGAIAIPVSATYDGVTYDVTSIGPYAFYLSDATEATLPASIAAVDGRAFRSSAVGSVSVDPANPNLASFDGCLYDSQLLRLLLIPEGRKGSVLLSCETEVVQASLFSHCSLVEAISVEEGGAAFSSWEGCLYDVSGTTLLRVPAGATDITIHDGCTTIAAGALEGCANLERINAPASVTSISPDVFTPIPTVSLPAASVSPDSQQVADSQDADDLRVAPMLASGQAATQPSSQDEASSGVASSLLDQGNASADSASQLTSMVALSTTDDGLPEVDASSITVVLPDDAPRALWEQVGFVIEGKHDDDPRISMPSTASEDLSDGLPVVNALANSSNDDEGLSADAVEESDFEDSSQTTDEESLSQKGAVEVVGGIDEDIASVVEGTDFTTSDGIPMLSRTVAVLQSASAYNAGETYTVNNAEISVFTNVPGKNPGRFLFGRATGTIEEYQYANTAGMTRKVYGISCTLSPYMTGGSWSGGSVLANHDYDSIMSWAGNPVGFYKNGVVFPSNYLAAWQRGEPWVVFCEDDTFSFKKSGSSITEISGSGFTASYWYADRMMDALGGLFSDGRAFVNIYGNQGEKWKNFPTENPTRPGFDFSYWRDAGNTAFTASSTISDRTSNRIYAVWNKKPSYLITLDRKGGSGGSSTVYYWSDMGYTSSSTSTIVLSSISQPTLSGWTFRGYTDDFQTNTYLYIKSDGTSTTRTISSDKTLHANWTKTVSLNANGGTAGSLTSLTAGIGRPLGQKCSQVSSSDPDYSIRSLFSKGIADSSNWAPTRSGYQFLGYFDTNAATGGTCWITPSGTGSTVTSSLPSTLYARWGATVTFDKKGGSGGTDSVVVPAGASVETVSTPSLSGWTFRGYTDDMGTATYLYVNAGGAGTTRTISSNKTLLANWTKTVSLNANGGTAGSLTSITAGIGRPLGQKCSQVSSSDPDYPIRSLFNQGITDSSTWAPTRAGYTFQGYYDTNASSGGTCYINASGTAQSACNPVTSTMPSTLYARWSKNAIYTITLDSQLWESSSATTATASATSAGTTAIYYWVGKGWYATASPSDTATAATTATALITQPTLAGYAYGGYWTGKAGTGTQKISGQKLSSTAAVSASATWYAKWTKNAVHAITLDKNGGTGGTSTIYEWYGKGWYATSSPTVSSTAAASITAPTRAGYAYKGYATSSTATSGSYWTSASTMPSSTAFSAAKTLYAVWQKNAVSTVNLYKNAGDTTTLHKTVYLWYGKGWYDTASPTDSSTALTTIGTPSWPGRTYKGFATSSTASAGSYWTDPTSFPSSTSSTFGSAAVGWTTNLYAVWQGNEVTLTWEPHNGSAATTTKQTHSTTSTAKVALPAAPTWAGRTFAGWYTAETGGTQVTNATDLPASSATCHAHWTEDAYTISYDYDGGSVSGNPTTYKVSSATFTLKNPTKTGYTFTGWSGTGLSGSANMSVQVAKGSTGDRSYTAHWKANPYAVEYYDCSGATLLSRDDGFVYDEARALAPEPDASAVTPGYEAVGWATSAGQASAAYGFSSLQQNLATGASGDEVKRLYLAESPKVITLSWVSLGKEFDRRSLTYSPDARVTMPASAPTNDPGWAFMGWWTAEEGGDEVTDDTPLPTDDATYYAHWAPVVAAAVPIEVTARVDLLGLEEQEAVLDDEGYQGYIESRSGEPLKVAEVSFEPLSGAGELFGADVSRVSLQALAEGSTSADYSFALDAAAALKAADGAAEAASLAPFALPDGYGTRKHVTYRFDIPDDVLASIDQSRFEQVTTPIGQVVYTVALA